MADIVFPGQTPVVIGKEFLPSNYDLVLYQGDYFSMTVTLKGSDGVPLNLAGYVGDSQIRSNFGSTEFFTATITIDEPNGAVTIMWPSSETSKMTPGSYVWDFQLADSNNNNRTYFAGDVTVYAEVTKG